MEPVRPVITGDGAIGKTSLTITYTTGTFPEEYIPTVIDSATADVTVDGKTVCLEIWDTAGHNGYDRLRPFAYMISDVVFLCFDIKDMNSFLNVKERWIPEIRHHAAIFIISVFGDNSLIFPPILTNKVCEMLRKLKRVECCQRRKNLN